MFGNVFFHVANLDNFFKFGKGSKYPRPDVIFIDPPRAGMHKFMTNYLPKFEAKKIVYISCNPSTHARQFNNCRSVPTYASYRVCGRF